MKIIITIKDKKNVDSTVDKVLEVGSWLEKRYKGFKIGKTICRSDSTTLIIEK